MDKQKTLALQLFVIYKNNERKILSKPYDDLTRLRKLKENDAKYSYLLNKIKRKSYEKP